jgi:Ca-activated chloride channel family protein
MKIAHLEETPSFSVQSRETGQDVTLAMQRLWLTGQVTPFGGRLLVEHTFQSAESHPMEVIYSFALPRDGALRSFRIEGEGFETISELRPIKETIQEYERGIDDGSLSVLVQGFADGLVNLTVGNLQPKEKVRVILEVLAGVERYDTGFRFRFPFTLAPAYHRQARVICLPGGGEIELPRRQFGDLILPLWKDDPYGLHSVGFDLALVVGERGLAEVVSPSHSIGVHSDATALRVGLAVAEEVPDRDLLLEAKITEPWSLAWSTSEAVSAIIGSQRFGESKTEMPRRIVFVLDRSGSMSGKPIEQAKRAIEAGIAALRPADRFSIVAFDSAVEALADHPVVTSDANRKRARSFLHAVHARGGTELAAGVEAAARMIGSVGGDLLLLTDGQVFGTADILARARRSGARIHALGIGSASQDRFLAHISDQTGDRSRFLTPRERVDYALLDLFASMSEPVASGVEVTVGETVFATRDIYPGHPVLVRGTGQGEKCCARWTGRSIDAAIEPAPSGLEGTLELLAGAEEIADVESRIEGEPGQETADRLSALPMADLVIGEQTVDEEDLLVEEPSRLEADGGMPGASLKERSEASLAALERFVKSGSTIHKGPFRHHVRRLMEFLKDAAPDSGQEVRFAECETLAR